jgi:hypothetical protein
LVEMEGDVPSLEGRDGREAGLGNGSGNGKEAADDKERYKLDLDGGALRARLIPNWTSTEFEDLVKEIADVTNELAEREDAMKNLPVYKAVWEHICEIERRFWPDI